MQEFLKRKALFRSSKLRWKNAFQWITIFMLCSFLLQNTKAMMAETPENVLSTNENELALLDEKNDAKKEKEVDAFGMSKGKTTVEKKYYAVKMKKVFDWISFIIATVSYLLCLVAFIETTSFGESADRSQNAIFATSVSVAVIHSFWYILETVLLKKWIYATLPKYGSCNKTGTCAQRVLVYFQSLMSTVFAAVQTYSHQQYYSCLTMTFLFLIDALFFYRLLWYDEKVKQITLEIRTKTDEDFY